MKREIKPVIEAFKKLTDTTYTDSLYYPAAFISAMRIVGGEDLVKNLQEPQVYQEYYIAQKEGDTPTRQNVYFAANSALDLYAQAQLNLKILAVEIRDAAPDFYQALSRFNFEAHNANLLSKVRNGYDDLALATAENKLYKAIRHQYPALRTKNPSQKDSPAKPKKKTLSPQ